MWALTADRCACLHYVHNHNSRLQGSLRRYRESTAFCLALFGKVKRHRNRLTLFNTYASSQCKMTKQKRSTPFFKSNVATIFDKRGKTGTAIFRSLHTSRMLSPPFTKMDAAMFSPFLLSVNLHNNVRLFGCSLYELFVRPLNMYKKETHLFEVPAFVARNPLLCFDH